MHWIAHLWDLVTGANDESGTVYGSWSGFLGSVQPGVLVTGGAIYWHHTCHVGRCWRPGRHPVDGTPYKACRKHHPAIPGRITAARIAEEHARSNP